MVGANRTLSLQLLSAEGVVLTGRLLGFADGRLIFADDLGEHMRFADEASADVKRIVDAYIECAGIAAIPAEDDPAEVITPPLSDPPVLALDASGLGCIIWCTGCSGDYGYLKVDGALDAQGVRVTDPQPAFAHLENFFFQPPNNAGVEQPAPRGTAAHLYRVLEYVHAPSLFAGTLLMVGSESPSGVRPSRCIPRPPFQGLSKNILGGLCVHVRGGDGSA